MIFYQDREAVRIGDFTCSAEEFLAEAPEMALHDHLLSRLYAPDSPAQLRHVVRWQDGDGPIRQGGGPFPEPAIEAVLGRAEKIRKAIERKRKRAA